jgi:hypothetical protein
MRKRLSIQSTAFLVLKNIFYKEKINANANVKK